VFSPRLLVTNRPTIDYNGWNYGSRDERTDKGATGLPLPTSLAGACRSTVERCGNRKVLGDPMTLSVMSLYLKRFAYFLLALLALTSDIPGGPLATAKESAEVPAGEGQVEFARDILPILSANCFSCHGPDESQRQADLRLDLESDAKSDRNGNVAVAPNSPESSEILNRLTSTDPNEVMPPPEFNRQVEPAQVELIRRWISQGATWQRHWAFEPVKKPAGDLDTFVARRLSDQGLALQPPAAPETLARRLALDLIGLPPSPEMVRSLQQAATQSPESYQHAYHALVDELLRRPEFGEHWARMWLDLARYADTKGYEKDRGRTMWPYRDWVIKAFNDDMPLSQFTAEQLAGDLLENPSDDQIIATAFHRNTMANDEGGTDDEEFRVAAVKDRINTTVQVWMGLTMGCAQCHTHKYDPISIDEYYRFYAIFNQTEDADRHDDAPRKALASDEQRDQRKQLNGEIAAIKTELARAEEAAAWESLSGEPIWTATRIVDLKSSGGTTLTEDESDHSIVASGPSPPEDTYEIRVSLSPGKYTSIRLEALPARKSDGAATAGSVGRSPKDPNFVVSEFTVRFDSEDAASIGLANARSGFAQDGWPVTAAIDGDTKTGWAVSPRKEERHVAIFDFSSPLEIAEQTNLVVSISQNYGGSLTLARCRVSVSCQDPKSLVPVQESEETKRLHAELASAEKRLADLNAAIAQLPIMRELPAGQRRQSRVHNRGNFLDQGDIVQPALLSSFHASPDENEPTRLTVANWLVSDDNPLTPRVWANRVWARIFGRGLVETEEDFGTLGASPTHPELLDFLAGTYRDVGWSHKGLIKAIVTSKTYQQSSQCDSKVLEIDPDNRLLSRAQRFRLSGETLRDQALAVSGLLSSKMGGPPVMPPQPDGLWRSTYSGEQWVNAEGEDRFRRGIYTYLKRTTPYPSLIALDGGSGEVCLIRRIRTNTPLQALVTLNDPVFLEAAAGLAKRMVSDESASDDVARIESGLRFALFRPVREGETQPLIELRKSVLESFQVDPKAANDLIETCRAAWVGQEPAEAASWIVIASAILNLDEFLTRN